jgi:hypothetical protein
MTFSRMRLMGGFLAAIVLILAAVAAMLSGAEVAAYVGSGLLCCAVPLAALIGWRLAHPARIDPTGHELGPPTLYVALLHLGAWSGIATGSAIWTLAAATLPFEAKAGFWLMGPAGVLVGGAMAVLTLWSMDHPFPTIRADSAGVSIGGGLATPWREIEAVAFRRSGWSFSHVEIRLRSGEILRPKTPLTLGIEDLEAFFAAVGEQRRRSEASELAQALQQPHPGGRKRPVQRPEDERLQEMAGEAEARSDIPRHEPSLGR